ncbi:hypothetical protein SAMN04487787_103282 [Kosakonia sacchari]|nr:hypothetical protein SAMN04487787_103282 [Kosakonia sacchari]
MRPTFVIVLPPGINDFPRVGNIAEPVLIQAFIPKATVKTLNKPVLRWLAQLDYAQFHSMLKGPLIERATGKFRALIGSYRRRIATKQRNAVQNTRDLSTWNPESSGNRQTLLREVIHAGQALNSSATGECIHDKIHRPGQLRCIRAQKLKPLSRQPFATPSAFYTQAVKMINAVNLLVINVKTSTSHKLPDTPVTKAAAFNCQFSDARG